VQRRSFLALGGGAAMGLMAGAPAPAFAFQSEKSKLKIDGVRLVRTRPKRPEVAA
jgi:hypothetical protein